jgi:hypothetical protein
LTTHRNILRPVSMTDPSRRSLTLSQTSGLDAKEGKLVDTPIIAASQVSTPDHDESGAKVAIPLMAMVLDERK